MNRSGGGLIGSWGDYCRQFQKREFSQLIRQQFRRLKQFAVLSFSCKTAEATVDWIPWSWRVPFNWASKSGLDCKLMQHFCCKHTSAFD